MATVEAEKSVDLDYVCKELQALQRQRSVYIKSRIMVANRLQALVAGASKGYHSGLEENERRKLFTEAGALIKQVEKGEASAGAIVDPMIRTHKISINGFNVEQAAIEKQMAGFVKHLSVVDWVQQPEQAGFGLPSLAVLIGETGNLDNYANPGKVWRRMGLAPWEHNDKNLMGSTWRYGKEGKLPASEWEEYGYSPRRRSVAYIFGENLIKQNGTGPYKTRYTQTKARAAENHPEWTKCSKCDGTGKLTTKKCSNCKGTGIVMKRCHLHGMLLATKLLLKNLWLEWTGVEYEPWE